MKKIIAVALLAILGSWAVFAQGAGNSREIRGGQIDRDNRGSEEDREFQGTINSRNGGGSGDFAIGFGLTTSPETNVLSDTSGGITGTSTFQSSFVGFKVIFDTTYFDASIGYSFWVGGIYEEVDYTILGTTTQNTHFDWAYIPITAMIKYPIFLSNAARIFPTVGLEYDFNTRYVDKDLGISKRNLSRTEIEDLNHFYVKVGVGADFSLGGNVFIRPEALFAYKIPSTFDGQIINDREFLGYTNVTLDTYKFDFGVSLLFKM